MVQEILGDGLVDNVDVPGVHEILKVALHMGLHRIGRHRYDLLCPDNA
jgi:hypothetical protein